MADLTIRKLDDETYGRLKRQAAAVGKSLEAYVRDYLVSIPAEPTVRENYALICNGPGWTHAMLRRWSDADNVTAITSELSPTQQNTLDEAKSYVKRNQPGDRENAIYLLKKVFNSVVETIL